MANYTAPQTQGFEFAYNVAGYPANPVPYELKPNTAFVKGMLVGMIHGAGADGGKIFPWVAASRYDQNVVVGVMAESIAQADNPAAGSKTFGLVYDNPLNVYTVTFVPGVNDNAPTDEATHTTTLKMVVSGGIANANRARGALVYFYEGPNKGQSRTITSTDVSNDFVAWAEPLPSIPTNATCKFYATSAASWDTDHAILNTGSIGAIVNDDSRRVNNTAALSATQQPVKVLRMDPAKLTCDVMLQGTLK